METRIAFQKYFFLTNFLAKKNTTAYHSRLILSILINDENGAIHLA